MDWIARITARLIRASWRAYGRKWSFVALFFLMFFTSVATLASLDLLPNAPSAKTAASVADAALASTAPAGTVSAGAVEEPMKIEIKAIGLSATIANPATTDATTLDAWLLKGAVRYPTSAKLGEDGNVVLFGHSSYLPVVGNQAYKTFDGIQKLKTGDTITVSSLGTAYTYQVRSVAKESANDGLIPLSVVGKVLTLATCNSFATKSDRFVVTADFVDSHPL